MDWQQLGVQMGIGGLIVVVMYRLAIRFIDAWQSNDAARTRTLDQRDKERTEAITDGFSRVTDVHASLLAHQQSLAMKVVAIDAKISAVFDLTPIHGTTIPPGIREAIETPSEPLEPEPKVIVSESSARKTPPGGVKVPRHKTVG